MRRLPLASALIGLTLAWSARAEQSVSQASPKEAHGHDTVALLRPDSHDPVLLDAFNRLQAELRLHDFEPRAVDGSLGTTPHARLAEIANDAQALASIAFVSEGEGTSVEVWLVDRVSGKTSMRRVQVGRTGDAASVLAIRAVDLLRVSLQEFAADERPPPKDLVDARPEPPPPVVRAFVPKPQPNWALFAEFFALFDGAEFGMSYGPALALRRALGPVELGVELAVPLVGAEFEGERAKASIRQGLGWLELRWPARVSEHFALALGVGAGAHWLYAQGQAEPPLVSLSESRWSAAFAGLAQARWDFSRSASWTLSLQAVYLAPGAGVQVLSNEHAALLPVLPGAATGLLVRL